MKVPSDSPHTLSTGQAIFLALIFTILLLCKWPYPLFTQANQPLWSEDGIIFIKQAIDLGPLSIFKPYAGYLHVITRCIAFVNVACLPLDIIPCGLFWSCAIIATAIFATILNWTGMPLAMRLTIPLAAILSPTDGEVFLTLTNLHWIFALLYPMLILQRPANSYRSSIISSLLIFLLGLNDPLILVAYPFFVFRLCKYCDRKFERMIFIATTTAAIIQLLLVICTGQATPATTATYSDRLSFAVKWALAPFLPFIFAFTGPELSRCAFHDAGVAVVLGTVVAVLNVAIVVAFVVSDHAARKIALPIFTLGYLFYASAIFRYRQDPGLFLYYGVNRYFFVPIVFFAASLAALLYSCSRTARFISGLALCVTFASGLSNFKVNRRIDNNWASKIEELKTTGTTTISVSPGPDWDLTLSISETSSH